MIVEMGKPSKMNKVTGYLKGSARGCYCTSGVDVSWVYASSSEGVTIHFLSLPHLPDIVKSFNLGKSKIFNISIVNRKFLGRGKCLKG